MRVNLSLIALFTMLLVSISLGITILYPLLLGLLPFIWIAYTKGYSLAMIIEMMKCGVKKPAKIYVIMLLIGSCTAVWLSSGAIPYLIDHAIKLIQPPFFIFFVFCLTLLTTLLIGSAIGSCGMVGVLFMTMAYAGGVDLALTAGAIVSALYLGERGTPVSSCANLVSAITDVPLTIYLKSNIWASKVPILITASLYLGLSILNPLNVDSASFTEQIQTWFDLKFWVLIPILTIFIFLIFKIDIRMTLFISMIMSIFVGCIVQHQPLLTMIDHALRGFSIDDPSLIAHALKSSGLFGMVRSVLIIIVASAYTGLFEGTDLLNAYEQFFAKMAKEKSRFSATLCASIAGGAIGCSQTFAILFTNHMMQNHYAQTEREKQQFATDIGNSAVITSGLIPWNVASSIPAAILGIGFGFIPFAFFLYLSPLYFLFMNKRHA